MNEDRSITAQLKAQVRDLQQSLKINKELMQNVLLEGITDQSVKDLIQRLEKENSRLSVALNKEHKEKIQLYEAIKKRKEQFDKDHEVMKDKEQKFDAYLKNFRKDLDERKRTIDKQAKTIDKLRPMAEKFEREGELRVRSPPASKKDPPPTENGNKNSNTSMESVEIDEIINENERLTKDLKKANEEIDRLRNNLCDVSDIVGETNALGKTFDYGSGMYTSGDADNPNFGKDLSQTFDMGLKPVVIPMLDMKRLNHVKTFKDWYGYSQKLEKSLKLLLGRIKSLQNERADFTSKLMKVKSQNQNLYKLNEKLNNTIKKLNIRLKEASNLRQRFEMTMPSMGSNYVSFTMSDNHKTAKNKKNFSNSDMNDNVDGLNRSFCTSDIESQSNLAKEVNQYLQNSSCRGKFSSDRNYAGNLCDDKMSQRGNKYNKVQSSDWCNDPGSEDKEASTQHKKSQCLSNDRIKESQSFLNSGFNELMESPNFMGEKQFNLNSENKVAKSRIKKKPQEVTKYKGRKKKRKVVKKASETFSDRQDQCTAPQKSIIRKAIKQFN